MLHEYSQRLAALGQQLKGRQMAAFFACTPTTMGYLTGFFEDGHERMLLMAIRPDGEPAMIVPSLTATHAGHTKIADIRPWKDGDDPAKVFAKLAADWGLDAAKIGVDDEMPARFLLPMQRELPGANFVPAGDVLAELRKAKSPDELQRMREAAKIADAAHEQLAQRLAAGMRETDAAKILTDAMREAGGEPTFCIVAGGAGSAEPHHATGDYELRVGDVVIADCGCLLDHYNSDITRTLCIGEAGAEAEKIYKIVYAAHMAARDAIRPGVPCEAIDAAARQVIEDAGYGEFFVHRTGHGIGMMLHEPPNIVKGSTAPLVEGQCFSVEPGIYLPGKFGVRIENIVTVTATGHESFNAEPPAELPVIQLPA